MPNDVVKNLNTNSSVSSNISVKNMGFDNKYSVNTDFVDLSHILYLKHKNFAPLLQRVQNRNKKCNGYRKFRGANFGLGKSEEKL